MQLPANPLSHNSGCAAPHVTSKEVILPGATGSLISTFTAEAKGASKLSDTGTFLLEEINRMPAEHLDTFFFQNNRDSPDRKKQITQRSTL